MGSKEVRKAAQAKQAAMRAKNRGKELTDEQNHKNGEELLFEVVLKRLARIETGRQRRSI